MNEADVVMNGVDVKFVQLPQKEATRSTYRHDVDCLRGFAVAIIVLFHFNPSYVPGGFVGVDVFFVISGWLITTKLLADMEQGSFSYATFMAHRVRRITPAAVVCIGIVIVAAGILMRGELRDQAMAACRASVFSVANLYFAFWIPSGYFDASSELNPVLHMWSLAVEEQFYLIWPLCLMGLVRIKREGTFTILFGVIAVSTLCGQLLFKTYPNVVYYTLLTRAGELLVGGVLAFSPMVEQAFAANRSLAEAGGSIGMLMVGVSCWMMSSETVFPGFAMLVPCGGAALMICSGFNASCAFSSMLARFEPVRLLGQISYSVYLYHWPILSLLRYLGVNLKGVHGVSAFMYVMVASVLSYVFVEKPFRRVSWQPRVTLALLFVVPTLIMFTTTIAIDVYAVKPNSSPILHHKLELRNGIPYTSEPHLPQNATQKEEIRGVDGQAPLLKCSNPNSVIKSGSYQYGPDRGNKTVGSIPPRCINQKECLLKQMHLEFEDPASGVLKKWRIYYECQTQAGIFGLAELNKINMQDPWATWGRMELWDDTVLGKVQPRVPPQAMCTPRTPHVCMDGCEWQMEGSKPCPCLKSAEQCWFGSSTPKNKPILLVGDSNAAAYIGVLEELAYAGKFRVWNRLHPGAAPFLFHNVRLWKDVTEKYLNLFDVVALGCQWLSHDAEHLTIQETVDELVRRNKTVIILGQVMNFFGVGQDCPNMVLPDPGLREKACYEKTPPHDLPCNFFLQRLAATRPRVLYWDINRHVCPGRVCSAYRKVCSSKRGCAEVRTYFEHSHVGYYGAKLFGDEIVRDEGVPWQFQVATALNPGETVPKIDVPPF
jgi:peptidoglycan/LPS O-acetylase OafA/YrhL